MVIYFIRHGDPNYEDDCLTEKGVKQAELLAERVKNLKLDEVYFSPQGRATQTGQTCMKYFDIKPVTKEWMKELEWGDLSGNAYSTESPWALTDEFLKTRRSYPSGESWKDDPEIKNDRIIGDVERREKCFEEFMAEHGLIREGQGYVVTKEAKDKTIAIFCHGGLSSALIAHLLNIPFWQYAAHFHIEMTGIMKIYIDESVDYSIAKAVFLNSYEHLGSLV